MTDIKFVEVERFEVVSSHESDEMLVCFMGRSVVEEGAQAWLDGRALFVSRSPHLPLRFHGAGGLLDNDLELLSKAKLVYLNRTLDENHHLVTLSMVDKPLDNP